MLSYLNEAPDNESWGIREFVIYVENDSLLGKVVDSDFTGVKITEDEIKQW